jgi:hypothetical protein
MGFGNMMTGILAFAAMVSLMGRWADGESIVNRLSGMVTAHSISSAPRTLDGAPGGCSGRADETTRPGE